MARIRFDLAYPPQNIAWKDYLPIVEAADRLSFEGFWSFDHLLTIGGDPDGPEHECYTTLAALAQATKRIRLGALVSGVTYRNPALQLKMATEIDVISNGRFDFGIGAGWAEREFRAFNIPFGSPKERIGMLRETLDLATQLWTGDPHKKVTYNGTYVHATDLFLNPQPVQRPRPPILIGGGGEQLTLRVVARFADMWHGFGDIPTLRHKIELIDAYAPHYGRSGADIVKSTNVQIWVGPITDDVARRIAGSSGRSADQIRASIISGTPAEIETRLRAYIGAGITHFVVSAMGPSFGDNWENISREIIPRFANG